MTQHRDIKASEEITSSFVEDVGKQRDLATSELESVKVNSGWQRIVDVVDRKIEEYTKLILDSEIQGESLSRARDKRDLCLWFRNCPDILIKAMEIQENSVIAPNLDPYNKRTVDKPIDGGI